jgi:transmembrane sensor
MSRDDTPAASAAADWFLRQQMGEAVENDPAFRVWLAEADAHRIAWQNACDAWASFDEEPDMLLAGIRQAALQARPPRRIARPVLWGVGSAVAAGVAALIAFQPGLFHMPAAPDGTDRPIARLAYDTPADARRDVTLPDGSHITLDRDTAMTATLYQRHREIALTRGQAYFAVAHDAARPFTVTAGGSKVTALGTEFDVLTQPQGMQVLLVSGRVAVADGDHNLKLAPGEGYDSTPGVRHVTRPDMAARLAWRDGYVEFSGEPLGRAVVEMNHGAAHHIVMHDKGIADLPMVTGRFKAGDTERFARALADIYGLTVLHRPDGTIELRRVR